jgi:hypothetical protein
MEIGELVAIAMDMDDTDKCPFKESTLGVDDEEDEGVEDDDGDGVQLEQQNDGGKLGTCLSNGTGGAGGTVGGPYPPADYLFESAPQDTQRGTGGPKLAVPGTKDVENDDYPFTVAAHHLIPGNAALGQSIIYDFLGPPGSGKLKDDGAVRKRKSVTADNGTKKKKVEFNKLIGFNINGSHNGIWLPGNYAIRKYRAPRKRGGASSPNTSPVGGATGGENWSDLGPDFDQWKLHYVAAASKVGKGQFHDTHEIYSDKVLGVLNKITPLLNDHILSNCKDCKDKKKLPPPFVVKNRFYAISGYLRGKLDKGYTRWKAPWYTSDHWGPAIFGSRTTLAKFKLAWRKAKKST